MKRWLAKELARRDNSLTGFWPLMTNLLDYSGTGAHAYQANAGLPNTFDIGPFGIPRLTRECGRTGYGFANQDFLSCGSSSNFGYSTGDSFSISLWMCQTGALSTTQYPLVSKIDPSSRGYIVNINNSRIEWLINVGSPINTIAVTSDIDAVMSPQLGQWNNIIVTYNGSGIAIGMKIFINGRQQAVTIEFNGPIPSPSPPSTNNLMIGGGQTNFIMTVANNIIIGMVRIYHRELRSNDIRQLYCREREAFIYKPLRFMRPPLGDQISLYMLGSGGKSTGTPLIVQCRGETSDTGSVPLFLPDRSLTEDSGDIILYLRDNSPTNKTATTKLFEHGYVVASSSCLLTTIGSFKVVAPMPLMVAALPIPTDFASTTLVMLATANPGLTHDCPLFVNSFWSETNTSMVLSLLGSPTDWTVSNMNLWTNGVAHVACGDITLFVHNDFLGGTAPLFMEVAGGLVGGQAAEGGMNLYIGERVAADGMSLLVQCIGTANEASLTLVISTSNFMDNVVMLAMPATTAGIAHRKHLIVTGW